MKKTLTTIGFITAFAGYALYQYFSTLNSMAYTVPPTRTIATVPISTPLATPITATPTPVVKSKSQYADGTYIGDVADAYYGNIQVQAIIQNGKLADVQFLQYPSDRSTSIRKNQMAIPILKSEAISTQSANVNIVSGATDSSQAFRQSLGSALTQAKNA